MSKFQIALEKLKRKALEKIQLKIIRFNEKNYDKGWDAPLFLKDDVCFNVQVGSSLTYVNQVKLRPRTPEVMFITENGYEVNLSIEQIVEIADSL